MSVRGTPVLERNRLVRNRLVKEKLEQELPHLQRGSMYATSAEPAVPDRTSTSAGPGCGRREVGWTDRSQDSTIQPFDKLRQLAGLTPYPPGSSGRRCRERLYAGHLVLQRRIVW